MKTITRFSFLPFLLLLIESITYANVDIVAKGDTLFVTYIKGLDSAFVYRYGLDTPVNIGEFWNASFGLTELPPGHFVLLWAGSIQPFGSYELGDSLILYDPTNMNVLIERNLSPDELFYWQDYVFLNGIRPARYTIGDDKCCVSASIQTMFTDSADVPNYRWITTFNIEVAPWGMLGVSDTLRFEVPYWDNLFHRPVHYQEAAPLMIAEHYYWPPWYYGCTSITAGEHTCSGQPGSMLYTNLFYEELTEPYGPDDPKARALALGSTDSCAIALWSDTTWTVYCSIFDDGLESVFSTIPFDRGYEQLFPACAMSCNPQDSGALLVWYEDGCIMGRHWEGEWNAYDRILATDQPPIDRDNLSVCSDINGYWIAWLPQNAAQPTVIYVERDIVTGIESPVEPNTELILSVRAFPNPFSDVISINVIGDSASDQICVFDLSGNLIRILDSSQSGDSFIWDGTDSNRNPVPSGVFLVQGNAGEQSASVLVVRI